MAATATVAQASSLRKPDSRNSDRDKSSRSFVKPSRGILTLYGYGTSVRVERGHLVIEDGIGSERHRERFPRVGHGLKRLVAVGSDGLISFAALRWLTDQNVAFAMLERDGSVLATVGPVRPSDARLRRAQALAVQTGADLVIARELIHQKLIGQEQVAREKLKDDSAAQAIGEFRLSLAEAHSIDAIRLVESRAAVRYWAAWRSLSVSFPKKDLPRVPDHWQVFGARLSPLTKSPRLAVNPVNAILNYLYALLESESRLAIAALGLDPGLGFLHLDTPARDSLACDLMEPIRPEVDAYVLDWIMRQPLRREWFLEERNGNARLMGPFAARLAETSATWARAVAPKAEWIAQQLWKKRRQKPDDTVLPTRLTQARKRQAKENVLSPPAEPAACFENICRTCGKPIRPESKVCFDCNSEARTKRMPDVARLGRAVTLLPEVQARRSEAQKRHCAARSAWKNNPDWLTEDFYTNRIQPSLPKVTNSAVMKALGVSLSYASKVRQGISRPHPMHWETLAQLAGAVPQ